MNNEKQLAMMEDEDFVECIRECDRLLVVKGNDYTMSRPNRLQNFDEAAEFLGLTPFQVLGVYLYKHVVSTFAFLTKGKVESERIEGRIIDCINYYLLLYKMVKRLRRATRRDN